MTAETSLDDVLHELNAIKRLLAYKFLKDGMAQADVAKALGINQSSVSRMFSLAAGSKGAAARSNPRMDEP